MAKHPQNNPRISVNKLAEFMTAKAGRQRQILRDQKYPTDYKGMYHKEAAEAISICVASNLENIGVVERAIASLEQISPEKIGTQRRVAANIDALEAFLQMLDEVDMTGATPSLGEHAPPKHSIQNVEISVRPEIILRGNGKAGPIIGAMKLHFPTTFALNPVTAGYVSAVCQEWAKSHLDADATVWGPYCNVVDIGSRQFYPGVKTTVARMRDVEAACQNIAALWPTITASG